MPDDDFVHSQFNLLYDFFTNKKMANTYLRIIEEAEQNTKLLIDELQRNISSFSKVNISYEILHGSKISIVNEIIKDKSDIGYLVIASNNQGDSPGELVEFISKSGFSIPVVVIPGDMKSETIDKLVGINK